MFFSLITVLNISSSISRINCEQRIFFGGVLALDVAVRARDGPVLAPDGKVLAPNVEILDTGWCSTGSQMVRYWHLDG